MSLLEAICVSISAFQLGEGLNIIKYSLESVSGGKTLFLQTPGLAGVWTLGSFMYIHLSVPEYTHLSLSLGSFMYIQLSVPEYTHLSPILTCSSAQLVPEICTFLT